MENWVIGQKRIAGKIHLGYHARYESWPEQRKMNVRRPPRIVMVLPRISSRLDGGKAVSTVCVRQYAAGAGEIRIQGRGMTILLMPITSRGIGLPNFHQRVWKRMALVIKHSARNDDALSERFAGVLTSKIRIRRRDLIVPINRT